jgi:hypothetical protein
MEDQEDESFENGSNEGDVISSSDETESFNGSNASDVVSSSDEMESFNGSSTSDFGCASTDEMGSMGDEPKLSSAAVRGEFSILPCHGKNRDRTYFLQRLSDLRKEDFQGQLGVFEVGELVISSKAIADSIIQTFQHYLSKGRRWNQLCWRVGSLTVSSSSQKVQSVLCHESIDLFEELYFHGYEETRISPKAISSVKTILHRGNLKILTLGEIRFTSGTMQQLEKALVSSNLQELFFHKTDIQPSGLCQVLTQMPDTLCKLKFYQVFYIEPGIISALTGHRSLTHLMINECSGNGGIEEALGDILADPSCMLQDLSWRGRLWERSSQVDDADALIDGLKKNQSLKRLDLSNRHLGDSVFEELSEHSSLEHLVLHSNPIERLDFQIAGPAQAPMICRLRCLDLTDSEVYVKRQDFHIEERNKTILQQIVKDHPLLSDVGGDFDKSALYSPETQALLDFNRSGRALLTAGQKLPSSIWPIVLERANKIFENKNAMYRLVRGLMTGPLANHSTVELEPDVGGERKDKRQKLV